MPKQLLNKCYLVLSFKHQETKCLLFINVNMTLNWGKVFKSVLNSLYFFVFITKIIPIFFHANTAIFYAILKLYFFSIVRAFFMHKAHSFVSHFFFWLCYCRTDQFSERLSPTCALSTVRCCIGSVQIFIFE